ncbi:MAG: hypothetical protein JNL67_18415 [Planctomycetaceae bacterium]|nr:hypothetical protein [Planctomycetaceae bacterium]
MLNRVRDFRYEDIKNWKPLVSLRESYRKESAVRNLLVLLAVCVFAVLFGFSIINGTWGSTNKLGQQADTSKEGFQAPKLLQSNSEDTLPSQSTDLLASRRGGETPVTSGGNGSVSPANYQKSESQSTGIQSTTAARSPRIAVCNVKLIIADELDSRARQLANASELQLAAEQKGVYENAGQLSDVELLLWQKLFEQKKALAVYTIREELRQYREYLIENLRSLADRIAEQNGYEMILADDHALSYATTVDITSDLQAEWRQLLRSQAQSTTSLPYRPR